MKRTVVDFKRTAAGDWLEVAELSFWGRLRGFNWGRRLWYWRPATPFGTSFFWAPVLFTRGFDYTPAVRPRVSWRVELKLRDALEEWEHDQPAVLTFKPIDSATPNDGGRYAAVFECDCGQLHPGGYVCLRCDQP